MRFPSLCRYRDVRPRYPGEGEERWEFLCPQSHECSRHHTTETGGARTKRETNPNQSRKSFRSKLVSGIFCSCFKLFGGVIRCTYTQNNINFVQLSSTG